MKKLIEALHVIQEECKKYTVCSRCPMGTEEGDCKLRDENPFEWKINKQEKALL